MSEEDAKDWAKVKRNQEDVIQKCLEGHVVAGRKRAIFMAGIPGAGKTEFVRNFQSNLMKDMVVVEHDQLVEHIAGYLPENYYNFRKAGSVLVTKLFDECLKQGYSFVFDGTLSHDNGYKNIEKSLKKGFDVTVIYIHQDTLSAWKLTQAREIVKKRAIEKQGFINTCKSINASLRKIFTAFNDDDHFAMWIIKKNGAPGLENSELIFFDQLEKSGSKKDIEQVLDTEYNVKELDE